jgi:predicted lipid carrier protein YhbT
MAPTSGPTPPLSPVLLAGFLARPLPPVLLQPALNLAMAAISRRHPGVFERLGGLDHPSFVIDPVDLPLVFFLDPDPLAPRLTAARDAEGIEATATIRGPLLTLFDLLEGRIDGDALFFSRDLTIEGDTEAVVALRNAVDGAEIDVVADVLSVLGPLAGPAEDAVDIAGALFARAARDLESLRAAVIAPALRQGEAQAAALRDLEDKVRTTTRRRPAREAGRS